MPPQMRAGLVGPALAAQALLPIPLELLDELKLEEITRRENMLGGREQAFELFELSRRMPPEGSGSEWASRMPIEAIEARCARVVESFEKPVVRKEAPKAAASATSTFEN